MIARYFLFLVFASATLVPSLFADKTDKAREAAALQDRAKLLSDIRAKGAPAFQLTMTFRITKGDGSVADGKYTELWVSNAKWRKEFVVDNFHRTQVVMGRKLWTLDNLPIEPEGLNNVPSLLDPMGTLSDTWKVERFKDRELNGISLRCFGANTYFGKGEKCFDKNNGFFAVLVLPIGRTHVDSTYSWSDYRQFGDRMVATSYENTDGEKLRSKGRLENLTFPPEFDQAMFDPPTGAKESAYCSGPRRGPEVIQQVVAVSPKKGNQVVTVVGTIGEDGTARETRVSKSADEDYDRAAINAVRQWRFKPATCDGDPMEWPFTGEIVFH
jgi:TonB family protein